MLGFSVTPKATSNSIALDSERVTDCAQLRLCVACCGLIVQSLIGIPAAQFVIRLYTTVYAQAQA